MDNLNSAMYYWIVNKRIKRWEIELALASSIAFGNTEGHLGQAILVYPQLIFTGTCLTPNKGHCHLGNKKN